MKVLLTGYSGFLGRHLARALKKNGFQVRVLLHRRTVTRKEFGDEADEVLWGSVTDRSLIRKAVDGVDAVVHAAWTFSPLFSNRPTVNEAGTTLLLEESIQSGVDVFAFISSVAVYGMTPHSIEPVAESSQRATGKDLLFLYPSEKIACEDMLRSNGRKGLRLAIFRPGPIFNDQKGPMKKRISIVGHSFSLGIGNGKNHMGYIHAEDVSEAVAKWLMKGKDGDIFNVTPSVHLSHREWHRRWAGVKDLQMDPLFIPEALMRLAGSSLRILMRCMGKEMKQDLNYAILSATRDIQYSNEALRRSLGWEDEATARYTR
ncbi:MAG: NAD(P)-dependent oxidoreductase [Thermodesulfobacteriota bacterium]